MWNLLEMEVFTDQLPGKHTKNHGKSPFLMGQLTISMAIFNSYVSLPAGKSNWDHSPQFMGLNMFTTSPKINLEMGH